MQTVDLCYEAISDDDTKMGQVYTSDSGWIAVLTNLDEDVVLQYALFDHYDDAEAHADTFCFEG
jgi:hypothetical protein